MYPHFILHIALASFETFAVHVMDFENRSIKQKNIVHKVTRLFNCFYCRVHSYGWPLQPDCSIVFIAEYIRMADQYIPVQGGTNNNNYANVELILDIAKRTQVQVGASVS